MSYDEILRDAVESYGGCVVKTTGDEFHAAFATAHDAVAAAVAPPRALVGEPWGVTGPLRVRMGLHTGEAQPLRRLGHDRKKPTFLVPEPFRARRVTVSDVPRLDLLEHKWCGWRAHEPDADLQRVHGVGATLFDGELENVAVEREAQEIGS